MRFRSLACATAVVGPLVLLGLAGCSGDAVPTYQPVTDPAQLYMRLALNHTAITMAAGPDNAPYDTLQLTATPLDARGDALQGLPAPMFHMANPADTASVQVSPDGLVTARQPTTGMGALVVADLAVPGNVRHADTALIKVTSASPAAPLDTLWMEAAAPADSAILAVLPTGLFGPDGHANLAGDSLNYVPVILYYYGFVNGGSLLSLKSRVHLVDAAQNPMSEPVVEYHALDPDVVDLAFPLDGFTDPALRRWVGDLQLRQAGQARLVAQATAYGVTKADTLTVTVTPPTFVHIPIRPALGATSLFGGDRTIRTNGIVMWLNTMDRPVNLVFDQPEKVLPAPAAYCDLVSVYLGALQIPDAGSHCPAAAGNLTVPQPAEATAAEIWKTAQLQQFPEAGTYTYHDAQTGASGRIIVTDLPSN